MLVRLAFVLMACVACVGCGGGNTASIPSDYSKSKQPEKPPAIESSTGPEAPPPMKP